MGPGSWGTVIGGIDSGWITVTVLVLVVGLALVVVAEVLSVGEAVSVTVAGGTGVAALVVMVDVRLMSRPTCSRRSRG